MTQVLRVLYFPIHPEEGFISCPQVPGSIPKPEQATSEGCLGLLPQSTHLHKAI